MKIKEKFWSNIEKRLYKQYPFILISIGNMIFGYNLTEN